MVKVKFIPVKTGIQHNNYLVPFRHPRASRNPPPVIPAEAGIQ